ncbi:N-alpha-acetyltransferase, non-catalitic subunit [Batrachochytrium dendrobatidis]|nr:N-alpha-acetyltransferase, non-catalitic subunit [Batrachochytrium dendrobatidis]
MTNFFSSIKPNKPISALKDVTRLMREATQELGLGEMLMSSHFSIVQAMSGVSIMDSKMDTGMAVPDSSERGKISVESIPTKNHWTISEICGVCDRLLALETEWLSGKLAAQTVFTCVYMHDIQNVSNRIMRVFLEAFLKQMSLARAIIMAEQIFFEEDFYVDMSGFVLEQPLDNEDKNPSNLLCDLIVQIQSYVDDSPQGIGDLMLEIDESQFAFESLKKDMMMLLQRMKFLKSLTGTFAAIHTFHFDAALEIIPLANATLADILANPNSAIVDSSFDQLINRKRFSQYPTKQMEQSSNTDAFKIWESTLKHIQTICQWPQSQSAQSIMMTVESFSTAYTNANVLTRSVLHAVLFSKEALVGKQTVVASARTIMSETTLHPYLATLSPRVKEILEHLNLRCAEAFKYNLELFCFNQARQRRHMFKVIEVWELFQQEAESLDDELQLAQFGLSTNQFYFTRWVYLQKLHVLTHCYSIGFELELYSVNEYPMIYWYLAELHAARINCIQSIRTLRDENVESRMGALSLSDYSQKNIDFQLMSELYSDTAKQQLSVAFLDLSVALRALGYLDIVEFHEAYTETAHYAHRFKIMTILASPQLLQTKDYLAYAIKDADQVKTIVDKCVQTFELAKASLNTAIKQMDSMSTMHPFKTEAQLLLKVCIANVTAIKAISWSELKTKAKDRVKPDYVANQRRQLFEFEYHKVFPCLTRCLEMS